MNPKVGRLTATVSAHGGELGGADGEIFLGRNRTNAAFIAEIHGQRKSNCGFRKGGFGHDRPIYRGASGR